MIVKSTVPFLQYSLSSNFFDYMVCIHVCVFSDVYVSNLSQVLPFNSTSTPITTNVNANISYIITLSFSCHHHLVIIINQLSIPPI